MKQLTDLERTDSYDDPFETTERNVEVACAFAIRAARSYTTRMPKHFDAIAFEERAIETVLKARDSYRRTKKATFFTWCVWKVNYSLIDEEQNQRRHLEDKSLDSPVDIRGNDTEYIGRWSGEDVIIDIRETSSETENLVDRISASQFFRSLTEGLSNTEKTIIALIHLREINRNDVAEIMNLPIRRVQYLESTSISKIRETFLKRVL